MRLQPLSQAILLESFPPEKRGLAMSVFALGVVVAPVLGPTLGGWLTETYSWRWAFYINIPVGIFAVLMIARFVEDPPYIKNAKAGKFDGIGLGLLAVWLGALQIVLDKGQEDDWFGAIWIRWAVAILVVAFVLFLVREFTHDKPLVRLSVFKNRNFAVGCVLIFLFGAVVYALVTLLPLFFQELLGYTALAAGLAVSPRGLGSLFFMPMIGILTDRLDNRFLVCAGFIFTALCSFALGEGRSGHIPMVAAVADRLQRSIDESDLRAPRRDHNGHSAQRRNRQRQRTLQPHAQRRRQHRDRRREHLAGPPRAGTSQLSGAFHQRREPQLPGAISGAHGISCATYQRRDRRPAGLQDVRTFAGSTSCLVVIHGRFSLSRFPVPALRANRFRHETSTWAGQKFRGALRVAPFPKHHIPVRTSPMTAEQFRKLVLSFSESEESAHQHHPDFRVRGKIFATLGYPDDKWAMVKVTPEQQAEFVHDYPEVFRRLTEPGAAKARPSFAFPRHARRCYNRQSKQHGKMQSLRRSREGRSRPANATTHSKRHNLQSST